MHVQVCSSWRATRRAVAGVSTTCHRVDSLCIRTMDEACTPPAAPKPQFPRSPGAMSQRCVSQGGRGGQKRARSASSGRRSVVGTSSGPATTTRNAARPLAKRQRSLTKLQCGVFSLLPMDVRASLPSGIRSVEGFAFICGWRRTHDARTSRVNVVASVRSWRVVRCKFRPLSLAPRATPHPCDRFASSGDRLDGGSREEGMGPPRVCLEHRFVYASCTFPGPPLSPHVRYALHADGKCWETDRLGLRSACMGARIADTGTTSAYRGPIRQARRAAWLLEACSVGWG